MAIKIYSCENSRGVRPIWTAEEMGLLGSRHFANRLDEMNITPSVVFNFDMIGSVLTNKAGKVYLSGYNMSDMAPKMNTQVNDEFVTFLPTAEENNVFRRSDNFPFYQIFTIPSHTIITFDFENYPDYHGVDDEIDKIDFENTFTIIEKTARSINGILENDTEINLQ